MIKKLDTLILKAFIGPFLATFLIALFVLVMQFFWLYIDDLVGKGLDFFTIARLTGYVAATATPLALPLALLLSSIMTFGNLGETFELVAIKSAGIPLLRFMRPLLVVSILVAGVAFLFNNNIIPVANLKLNTMKYDIIVAKPAFDIQEGVFYDKIEGYVIKIGQKDKDGSTIRNVIIYEKNYGLQDYSLIAESGTMRVTEDKKFLEFNLKNGWRYQEKGERLTTNTEYIRLGFKTYKKILDLSSFTMRKTEDSVFQDNYKMLSIRQLTKTIDSLRSSGSLYQKRAKMEIDPYFTFARYEDSSWNKVDKSRIRQAKSFDQLVPEDLKYVAQDRALAQITSAKSGIDLMAEDYNQKQGELRYHEIEWHRKLTLSFACIVLFLIGAPLGSIIRKGGLGTPLVFAVVFFIIFHLFNTFGEKLVKQDVISPFSGMWLSTAVLIPISIFLIVKAMRDSQLFNQEFYYRSFRKLKKLIGTFRQAKIKNA